jgi:hypothetical protein
MQANVNPKQNNITNHTAFQFRSHKHTPNLRLNTFIWGGRGNGWNEVQTLSSLHNKVHKCKLDLFIE